jgi:hypothetical protein
MLDSLVRVSRRDDKKHFVLVEHIGDGSVSHTGIHPFLPNIIKQNLLININANEVTLLPIGSFSAISGTL